MEHNIKSTNASLNKRIEFLKYFAIKSDINILLIEHSDCEHFIKCIFEISGERIEFNFLMKNIVGSGWADKPYIKRIQIPPLFMDKMPLNKNKVYSCLLGNIFIDDRILFVAWNPFRFTGHKKNRSCYVYDQSLIDCIENENGIYKTIDSNKELIIFDEHNLLNFLKLYIKHNKIDDYEL